MGGQLMLERLIILIEVQQHQPSGIEQTEIMIRQADLFSAAAGQVADIFPSGEDGAARRRSPQRFSENSDVAS